MLVGYKTYEAFVREQAGIAEVRRTYCRFHTGSKCSLIFVETGALFMIDYVRHGVCLCCSLVSLRPCRRLTSRAHDSELTYPNP